MSQGKEKAIGGGVLIALLIGLIVRTIFVATNNADQQEQRDQEMKQRIQSEVNGLQRQLTAMTQRAAHASDTADATLPASQPIHDSR